MTSENLADRLIEAHLAYAQVKRGAVRSERVQEAAERDERLRQLRERLWGLQYGEKWWGQ